MVHVRPDASVVEGVLRGLDSSSPCVLLDEEPSQDLLENIALRIRKEPESQTGIFIQTSGTTGKPKVVFVPSEQLWDSSNPSHDAQVWGLTFPAYKMAGLQVIAQAIVSGARLVAPAQDLPPLQKLEKFSEAAVEAISATPSFWRMASGFQGQLEKSLRFITLGGEIADQKILDYLNRHYPNTKISHVYATSETGAVFSVGDGFAGFPASYEGKIFRNGKSISVVDGEILVHLPIPRDKSVNTGDFVVLHEGRYLFDGRSSSHINVNGRKVSLTEIERATNEFDGVFDCRATGIPNPFSGQSVLLEVIWSSKANKDGLFSHLRNVLPREALPALIEAVGEFAVNDNQKKLPRGTS